MASYRGSNGGHHSRGNQQWNQRPLSSNNMQLQPQAQMGFVPTSNAFMPPQMLHGPIRPFANNAMYPDMAPAMMHVQGPTPTNTLRSQFQDPDLKKKMIVKQIDYYFSNENLVKDVFLRQKMDQQGWVPVNVIASFNKVSSLTDNVHLILDVMRRSTTVEVKGIRMRKRNDWMRWLIPRSLNVDSFFNKSNSVSKYNGFQRPTVV